MAIRNTPVQPDSPVVRIDSSNFRDAFLDPQAKDSLSVFFPADEVDAAESERVEALDYHSAQADSVLAHDGWVEIEANWLDSARAEADAKIDWDIEGAARTYVYDPEGREYDLLSLPKDGITIHQFYEDLYGLGSSVWNYDQLRVLVNHRDRKHPYQMYDDYLRFITGVQRETSFIYMGTFWVPPNGFLTAKSGAMTTIGGFCVDIDRVDDKKGRHFPADMFINKLFELFDECPEITPNYVHLSGSGVQLWYVFGRLIPLLSSKKSPRRGKYNELLKRLYGFFSERLQSNLFKVDTSCAHINCALRAPGSPAKMHYPTRLFVRGGANREMIDPLELADFLEVDFGVEDTVVWDAEWQAEWELEKQLIKKRREDSLAEPATEKQLAYIGKLHDMRCLDDEVFARACDMDKSQADEAIKAGESEFSRRGQWLENGGYIKTSAGRAVARKVRARGLYDYTLSRIQKDTPTGTRYWALFGLAGLAWNCCVPKKEARRDMESLLETDWAREVSKDGKPLGKSDVVAAMRGYNELGALRSRELLEHHLGWEYAPSAKRNGRSRHDHLWSDWHIENEDGEQVPVVNTARENRKLAQETLAKKRMKNSVERLAEFLASHPSSSKRFACQELSMSRSTVTKYWEKACSAAGIADMRTGNHNPY